MDQIKLGQALDLIAGSIETGYSSVYTYAVKEFLSNSEKQQLAALIRRFSTQISGTDQPNLGPDTIHPNELPHRH
jgi:hypothetical protein